MTLLPTWLEGAPPGPPGPDTSLPCGSYSPHTQGLVSFPTQLFNLLSGEVGAGPPETLPPALTLQNLHLQPCAGAWLPGSWSCSASLSLTPAPPSQGYLEWSPLFYGFYPPRKYLAVTYLCSVFAVGLICLLLILHRSVPHTS